MERKKRPYLKDWSKNDKLCLYQAIRTHGSYDIDEIQNCIPDKSRESITEALIFYKKKALKQEDHSKVVKERNTEKNQPLVPLNSWAKLLTETIPFNELHTETAMALRMIADFEDIPQAVCTEKIDFKKIYHTLANALEGKALCEDKVLTAVIDKCIVETALTGKAFMKCNAYKNALKDIRINDRDLSPFKMPTENSELSIIRQIAMHKNYNPLNIPEQHLKFSFFS